METVVTLLLKVSEIDFLANNFNILCIRRGVQCLITFSNKNGTSSALDKREYLVMIQNNFVKDKYSLLYRTHPKSLLVLWPCYVITYVRWGISFEEMCVTGHNRIMTHNKQSSNLHRNIHCDQYFN